MEPATSLLREVDRHAGTPVEIGRPSEWTRGFYEDPDSYELVPRPVAATAAAGIAVLFDGDSAVGAIGRFCPHRQADLARHARPGSRPGNIACRHAGYEWDACEGSLACHGGTGPAGDLDIWPIEIRDDGVAVAYLPSA